MRDIENKFRRQHYYSIKNSLGKHDDALERQFFQVLDSKVAEACAFIFSSFEKGEIPNFSKSANLLVRQFIYFQEKRSPDFIAHILRDYEVKQEIESAIGKYESQFGRISLTEKVRLTSDPAMSDMIEFARVINIARQSEPILDVYSSMSLAYAVAPETSEFIIGSHPVLRFENKPNAILGDGFVEKWTPISPKIAIGLIGPFKNHEVPQVIKLSKGNVRLFNEQIYKHSTEVASRSEALLKSIVNANMTSIVPHR